MFENAIETTAKFTRSLHSITRNYKSENIYPGTATLFFVNEQGYALTSKWVMDDITDRFQYALRYLDFRKAKEEIDNENYDKCIIELEKQFNLNPELKTPVIQSKELFLDCVNGTTIKYNWIDHPRFDISIIKFEEFDELLVKSFARFAKDGSLKQGKQLCRLGFPFPEFDNFKYNAQIDELEWLQEGRISSPNFALEGMITRNIHDGSRSIGFELSSQGMTGMLGAPVFDTEGIIHGIQYGTRFPKTNIINNFEQGFRPEYVYHPAQCINSEIIKEFLTENGIKFYEE